MDAYDLYHKINEIWAKNIDKNSGVVPKNGINTKMSVCVWTENGYTEIKDVVYNSELKIIELELDK